MTELKLISLSLQNFMGCMDITIKFDGNTTTIYGVNTAGKTTIATAYTWLMGLTSKEVKPRDSEGNEIHNLTTSVEGVFTLNGEPLTLKKVMLEDYGKSRGELVYKGNTYEYYIKGIENKQKDYNSFLDSIAPENVRRLCTDINYFNSDNAKWNATIRRAFFIENFANVNDDKICETNKECHGYFSVVGCNKQQDVVAMLKKEIKELEDKKLTIPTEIKTLQSTLNSDSNKSEIECKLNKKQNELSKSNDRIATLKAGAIDKEKQSAVLEARARLENVKHALENDKTEKLNALRESNSNEMLKLARNSHEKNYIEKNVNELKDEEAMHLKNIEVLKTQKAEWLEQKYSESEGDSVCKTCGQVISLENRLEAFNLFKSQKLSEICESGSYTFNKLKETRNTIGEKLLLLDTLTEAVKQYTNSLSDTNEDFEKEKYREVELDEAYVKALEELNCAEKAFEDSKNNDNEIEITKLQESINTITGEITDLKAQVKLIDENIKTLQRIDKLKQEFSGLSAKIELYYKNLNTIKAFNNAKAAYIEGNIKKYFSFIDFKLFRHLVSGELEECCVATVQGVPVNQTVSTSQYIKACVDIVSGLQKFYGVLFPIFIDFSESVNEVQTTDCQQIRLKVIEPWMEESLSVTENILKIGKLFIRREI